MIPADEVLEALDLSRAEPGSGFLEALFARFNAKVPFENVSKIVRNAEIADAASKPRPPEVFWTDHLERGAGGTCFARVAAFHWLLGELGFRSRRLVGNVQREGDHATLLVETPAGETLADVGFPLPALVPARAGTVETSLGALDVTETPGGFRIAFREGVPEGPRSLEILTAPVSEERFAALWRDTYRPGSRFLLDVCLRRDLGNRVLSFASGELRVDDLHSRLRLAPAGDPQTAIAEHFGIDRELLARAFAQTESVIAGGAPTLTAYLETSASAADAYGAISTPEGYRKLLGGVAEVVGESAVPGGGFRIALAVPGGGGETAIEDEVSAEPAALAVSVRRLLGASAFASSYRVLQRGRRTYLLRETVLPGRGDELLRNDSLRGRFAGILAVDLLAWTRML